VVSFCWQWWWARSGVALSRHRLQSRRSSLLSSLSEIDRSTAAIVEAALSETGETGAIQSSKFWVRSSKNLELRTSSPRTSRESHSSRLRAHFIMSRRTVINNAG
jgi:hypothetical protein